MKRRPGLWHRRFLVGTCRGLGSPGGLRRKSPPSGRSVRLTPSMRRPLPGEGYSDNFTLVTDQRARKRGLSAFCVNWRSTCLQVVRVPFMTLGASERTLIFRTLNDCIWPVSGRRKINGGCQQASDTRCAGRVSKCIVDRVKPTRMRSAIMTTTAARWHIDCSCHHPLFGFGGLHA
jgi:hypothetical protein